jgi:hypothetical protein
LSTILSSRYTNFEKKSLATHLDAKKDLNNNFLKILSRIFLDLAANLKKSTLVCRGAPVEKHCFKDIFPIRTFAKNGPLRYLTLRNEWRLAKGHKFVELELSYWANLSAQFEVECW